MFQLIIFLLEDWHDPNFQDCTTGSPETVGFYYWIYDDGNKQYTETRYTGSSNPKYTNMDDGDLHGYYGSFCPSQAGYYEMHAYTNMGMKFELPIDNYKDTVRDGAAYNYQSDANKYKVVYIPAHACIPFIAQASRGGSSSIKYHLNVDYKYSPTDPGKWNNIAVSSIPASQCVTCKKSQNDRCLYGYVTSNCVEYIEPNTVCRNGGIPGIRKGQQSTVTLGCDNCPSNANSNPFCESTTNNAFFPNYGLETRKTDCGDPIITNEKFVQIDGPYDPYTEIIQTGHLYISNPSKFDFQLISRPSATFTLSNSTFTLSMGSLSHLLTCDPEMTKTTITRTDVFLKRGFYKVTLKYHSGCSLYDCKLSLKWRYHLINYNNPSSYEEIPIKYLQHKQNKAQNDALLNKYDFKINDASARYTLGKRCGDQAYSDSTYSSYPEKMDIYWVIANTAESINLYVKYMISSSTQNPDFSNFKINLTKLVTDDHKTKFENAITSLETTSSMNRATWDCYNELNNFLQGNQGKTINDVYDAISNAYTEIHNLIYDDDYDLRAAITSLNIYLNSNYNYYYGLNSHTEGSQAVFNLLGLQGVEHFLSIYTEHNQN